MTYHLQPVWGSLSTEIYDPCYGYYWDDTLALLTNSKSECAPLALLSLLIKWVIANLQGLPLLWHKVFQFKAQARCRNIAVVFLHWNFCLFCPWKKKKQRNWFMLLSRGHTLADTRKLMAKSENLQTYIHMQTLAWAEEADNGLLIILIVGPHSVPLKAEMCWSFTR